MFEIRLLHIPSMLKLMLNNMATTWTTTLIAVITVMCLIRFPMVDTAVETRVHISSKTNPVTVGGILALRCQVRDLQHDYTINIFRILKTKTEQVTYGEEILRGTERLNMYMATRTFSDGSRTYFLTMVDVSDHDEGEYICKVVHVAHLDILVEDSIDLEIYSYPANMYPICSSIPNKPIAFNVHDTLTVKCTSEMGTPLVDMKWYNMKSATYLPTYDTMEGNLIHSQVTIPIDNSLHGALFQCQITSNGLPDWNRMCTIGPIKVISYDRYGHGDIITSNTAIDSRNNVGVKGMGKAPFAGTCGQCSSSSDTMEFYLIVGTVGTGLLTILFIVTTIMMCHKYHSISDRTRRQPTRVLTSQQSVEPVYVSLQRRPQSTYSEREYMTLQDPNNPDNKIILPKDTFDDYCRTMSLKRV